MCVAFYTFEDFDLHLLYYVSQKFVTSSYFFEVSMRHVELLLFSRVHLH